MGCLFAHSWGDSFSAASGAGTCRCHESCLGQSSNLDLPWAWNQNLLGACAQILEYVDFRSLSENAVLPVSLLHTCVSSASWLLKARGRHGRSWAHPSALASRQDLSSKKPTHVDIKQLAPLTRSGRGRGRLHCPNLAPIDLPFVRQASAMGQSEMGETEFEEARTKRLGTTCWWFGIRIVSMLHNFHVYLYNTVPSIKIIKYVNIRIYI